MPGAQAALDDELARNDYDAVFFEGLFVAGYRVPSHIAHCARRAQHRARIALAKLSTCQWCREARLQLAGVSPPETAGIAWCRRADLVLVTSETEQLLLHALLPEKNVQVVPERR